MAFSISPAVITREIDRSLYALQEVQTIGAIAGTFNWGPAESPVLITRGEEQLLEVFSRPTDANYSTFLSCVDFLSYTSTMHVNRAVGDLARNSTSDGNGIVIKNDDEYDTVNIPNNVKYVGKYIGAAGNGIIIDIKDKDTFAGWEYAENFEYVPDEVGEFSVAVIDGSGYWTGSGSAIQQESLSVTGEANGGTKQVDTLTVTDPATSDGTILVAGIGVSVANADTTAEVATKIETAFASSNLYTVEATGSVVTFTYRTKGAFTVIDAVDDSANTGVIFTTAISTPYNPAFNVTVFGETISVLDTDSNSEIATKIVAGIGSVTGIDNVSAAENIISYDRITIGFKTQQTGFESGGLTGTVSVTIAGTLGTILERYELVRNDPAFRFDTGQSGYFRARINSGSQYIRHGDETQILTSETITLSGGVDDNEINLINAFTEFEDAEQYDVQFLIAGDVDVNVQKAIVDIADSRRDCIAFVSPMFEDVINKTGRVTNIIEWRETELNKNSSYMFHDDNWGFIYDAYNDKNRWIPSCSGTAGLSARTWGNDFPWFSPAGLNRGRFRNYVRTAWSAKKGDRDQLYASQVNSVVTRAADGIVLWGDKTGTTKPSAFDRINVRSLFIIVEKTMANFSKYLLFEQNDEITRRQFLNTARPYLRQVQGQRGITDFRIVCDETNNTGIVIDQNTMVADMFIRPTKSINFIRLNFIAVGNSVSFDEVISEFAG